MGIKRKWWYYGNRVRLTKTIRDLWLSSTLSQHWVQTSRGEQQLSRGDSVTGDTWRVTCPVCCEAAGVDVCHSSLSPRCLSQDCCSHWREERLRPVLGLRLTLTDVASASSRDQRLRSPPVPVSVGRLWSRAESWKQHEVPPAQRIMHNDFPYLHSPGTSCVYFVQYLFPFAFYNCIIYYILYSTSTQHNSAHYKYQARTHHNPPHNTSCLFYPGLKMTLTTPQNWQSKSPPQLFVIKYRTESAFPTQNWQ